MKYKNIDTDIYYEITTIPKIRKGNTYKLLRYIPTLKEITDSANDCVWVSVTLKYKIIPDGDCICNLCGKYIGVPSIWCS